MWPIFVQRSGCWIWIWLNHLFNWNTLNKLLFAFFEFQFPHVLNGKNKSTHLKELLRITAFLSFTELSPEFCWIWLLLQVQSVYSKSSYAGCWNFQIFTKNTLSSGLPGIGHCFPLLMPFSDTLFLFLLFFLALPLSLWDLSSLTRDWAGTRSESTQFSPN